MQAYQSREKWHAMSILDVEKNLKTNIQSGLSPKVCRSRLERYGRNTLFLPQRVTVFSCLKTVLSDPSLLVLALVSLIALSFDETKTAILVFLILLASCCVSTVAYVKSNQMKEKMSTYSAPRVKVLRGGRYYMIDASHIVPGDILFLEKGDIVPCDARLVDNSDDLCVFACVCDGEKNKSYQTLEKDSGSIELPNAATSPFEYRNILHAGTMIHEGSARAIVTETGQDTCFAHFMGDHSLRRSVGNPSYYTHIKRYLHLYNLVVCIAMIPIALIGLFSMGENADVFEVFLLSIALIAGSASEQVISMFHVICAASTVRAMYQATDNTAIIKNYRVLDELGQVDELFLLGDAAVYDGILHAFAVYTDDAMYHGESLPQLSDDSLLHFAYWYEKGIVQRAQSVKLSIPGICCQTALQELIAKTGFDTESSDIRLLSVKPRCENDRWFVGIKAQNSQSNGVLSCTITRETAAEAISHCTNYRRHGEALRLSDEKKKQLFGLFRRLSEQGTTAVAYITQSNDQVTFEGMLIMQQQCGQDLKAMQHRLNTTGVRASLFLKDENESTVNALIHAGWVDSVDEISLFSKDFAQANSDPCMIFEKKRVFLGYPEQTIAHLMSTYKQNGKTIASFGLRHDEASLMNLADVCMSCEAYDLHSGIPFHPSKSIPLDRNITAISCDQTIRHNSDVLLHRASAQGGGLQGILNAIFTARSVNFRVMLAMQYLIVVQFLRIVLVVVPLLLGNTWLSPITILMSGHLIDLGGVLIFAFHHCSRDILREPPKTTAFFTSPVRRRPDWPCAAVLSGMLLIIIQAIIQAFGWLTPGKGTEAYWYLVLLSAQVSLIFCLLRAAGPFYRKFSRHASTILVFAITFSIPLLILLIPPLATWFGCQGMSWRVVAFALLSPLCLIGTYLFSCRFRVPILRHINAWKTAFFHNK